MTLLFIGIDEAGYGPLLGPLCHGSAAFRIENFDGTTPPDLWQLLHPAVSQDGSCGIAIGDSKALYSTKLGIGSLSNGVRAFLCCIRDEPLSTLDLSTLIPAEDCRDIESDRWAALSQDDNKNTSKYLGADLRVALKKSGVNLAALTARAMSVRTFNAAVNRGANKADINWSVAAAELKRLATLARPGETIIATIDRQGGRKFYSGLLCEVFDCALARTEREDESASIYTLEKDGRKIQVGFYTGGDALHLPIALASMCAKLARELIMRRLNAFFQMHDPKLVATAGYYTDAQRFLKDTRSLRNKLEIADTHFIRAR